MSVERRAMIEANNLTAEQYNDFLTEIEKIPSPKAMINGKEARLCFEFMEDTGSRVTETLHVLKKDLNIRTRILRVTHPKSESICDCSKWRYRDLYSRVRILESARADCSLCHGKGKWKQPQKTTVTPRLIERLSIYCDGLKDDELLFPITRKTLWKWGKEAGVKANINIFQEKKEKTIDGIFLHLFRELCSKRMIEDAQHDPYKDQLISCKLRHALTTYVTDRYTKIDINYLWSWEEKTYHG